MDYSINFPHLGLYLSHVGKSFHVFGLEIAYYGVTMALAMLGGLAIASWVAKKTKQNPDDYLNLALIGIVVSLLSARAYYVIFTWDYYSRHPLEILNFRGGGIAMYGAAIGAVATCIIFAKRKKLDPRQMLDTGCIGLVTGQIIGRWGNFFNREAFGEYTDGLLAMQLPVNAVRADEITDLMKEHEIVRDGVTYIQVSPTFLYESLWNVGVLTVLLIVTLRGLSKFRGEVFLLYTCFYGAGRFWIEGLRTDQLRFWGTAIAVSQVLAAVLFAVSLVLIIVCRTRAKNKQ